MWGFGEGVPLLKEVRPLCLQTDRQSKWASSRPGLSSQVTFITFKELLWCQVVPGNREGNEASALGQLTLYRGRKTKQIRTTLTTTTAMLRCALRYSTHRSILHHLILGDSPMRWGLCRPHYAGEESRGTQRVSRLPKDAQPSGREKLQVYYEPP